MNKLKDKWEKHFKYILFGTILWGVFILPLFYKFFVGDVVQSGGLIFFSVLFSILATSSPIYWGFPLPPEGKEFYILILSDCHNTTTNYWYKIKRVSLLTKDRRTSLWSRLRADSGFP